MSRKRRWPACALNHVLVEIYEHKVVGGKLELLIPAFDTNDVRARRFEGLKESSWENWNEDTSPLERKQQLGNCSTRETQHAGVRR
jgi:hypothetical protein